MMPVAAADSATTRIRVLLPNQALAAVKQIVSDVGYEPVVVGGLATAKKFDAGSAVYPKAMPAGEMRKALGLT